MIKKEMLIRRIDAIIYSKKKLTPLLNKHISSSLSFSGLELSERDAVIEKLQSIVITQTKHVEILNGIKDELAKEKRDVY